MGVERAECRFVNAQKHARSMDPWCETHERSASRCLECARLTAARAEVERLRGLVRELDGMVRGYHVPYHWPNIEAALKGEGGVMDKPHDWVGIDVSDDCRIRQCAPCRIVFVEYCTVRNGVPTAAGEYHPAHVANPQNCTREDMTEEAAAESGAEAAELVAEIVADLLNEFPFSGGSIADYIEQKWGKK